MATTTKSSWRPSRRALIVLALISLTLAGAWLWLRQEALQRAASDQMLARAGAAGEKLPASLPEVSFDLVNHKNEATTSKDFSGQFLLVVFGYTFCPDICPTTLQNMTAAMDKIASDESGREMAAQIQPLFITIDPARDSIEVLAEYVAAFDERLIGLTGSRKQIAQATKDFRVYVGRPNAEEAKDGDYFLDHSAFIYLVAPNGRMVNYFPHETTANDMARKIMSSLAASVRRPKSP